MLISHCKVISALFSIFYFPIIMAVAINLENATGEFAQLNQKIGNYTKWLTANAPFMMMHYDGNETASNCLDIAISYSPRSTLDNNWKQKAREELFMDLLLEEIFRHTKIPVKHRSKFRRNEEMYFCDYFLVISVNENQIFEDIRQWSLTRKSKYFIVLFPYEIIASDRHYSDEIKDAFQWPTDELFTHAQVVLVINYGVFKLGFPFGLEPRQFVALTDGEFRTWNQYNVTDVIDFRGKHLIASTVHCPSQSYWSIESQYNGLTMIRLPGAGDVEQMCTEHQMVSGTETNTCRTPDGIEGNIMRILASHLNFTWEIRYPLKGEYGDAQSDGSEDGMVGEAHFGRVHLIFCNLWVQYPRNMLIDFTTSFFETCITFLVPRPKALPLDWFSIFESFSPTVWIGLLSVFIFCLTISWSLGKFNWVRADEKLDVMNIFLELIGILTTGNSIRDTSIPGYTILLTSWSIFCLNMIAVYSCALISAMTVPKFSTRIDTPEDFAAANLTWGTFAPTDNVFTFDPKRAAHRKMVENFHLESYSNTKAVENQVNGGRYAIMMTNFGGTADVQLGISDFPVLKLRLMRHCLYKPYTAFGFSHNSAYKPPIDRLLVRLFESGIFDFIKKSSIRQHHPLIWESMFVETDFQEDSEPEVLTIRHIYGAFIVWFIGLSLAFLVFLIENVKYKRFCKAQVKAI